MNHKILEILPKSKECSPTFVRHTDYDMGYNQAIDEVTEALNKNEVGICPSEEELLKVIERNKWEVTHRILKGEYVFLDIELARAIRKLILEGK